MKSFLKEWWFDITVTFHIGVMIGLICKYIALVVVVSCVVQVILRCFKRPFKINDLTPFWGGNWYFDYRQRRLRWYDQDFEDLSIGYAHPHEGSAYQKNHLDMEPNEWIREGF